MEAALHAGSFLAADLVQPLSENSHRGHRLSTAILYPGVGFVNSNTATGLRVCLYDDGRGSRSTGKERDSESGLDYFGARYYLSALGRFTTADWSAKPEAVPYAKFDNPETLNLYAYVGNSPLSLTDADGHCMTNADISTCLGGETFLKEEAAPRVLSEQVTLPKDPSGLGKEWVRDLNHKAPNGEIWVRDDGTKLGFDRGQAGEPKWGGRDHWHVYQPGERKYDKSQGDRGHLKPGEIANIPDHPGLPDIPIPVPPELKPDSFSISHPSVYPVFLPGFGGVPTGVPVPASVPTPMFPEPLFVWCKQNDESEIGGDVNP